MVDINDLMEFLERSGAETLAALAWEMHTELNRLRGGTSNDVPERGVPGVV